MTVFEKVEKLALKKYKAATVDVLKTIITNDAYLSVINKYIDEAKLRIVRQKQDEANNYEPTDEEIIERLQAKLDATK